MCVFSAARDNESLALSRQLKEGYPKVFKAVADVCSPIRSPKSSNDVGRKPVQGSVGGAASERSGVVVEEG
jgi:hypothetical protein